MSFKMATILLFLACLSAVKATTTIMIMTTGVSEMPTTTTSATTSVAATPSSTIVTATTSTPGAAAAQSTPGAAAAQSTPGAAAAQSTPGATVNPSASAMLGTVTPATAAFTPTPSASSSATASAGASCSPMNSTQCDKTVCCKGSSAAWSGVDSTKNVNYNETTCNGGMKAYVPRQKPCAHACVNKECDGGASGLMVQSTTVLLSLLACWILTSS